MPKFASSPWGHVYVRHVSEFAGSRTREELVAASDLNDAKSRYGWSGMKYTDITVRRATWQDVDRLGGLGKLVTR